MVGSCGAALTTVTDTPGDVTVDDGVDVQTTGDRHRPRRRPPRRCANDASPRRDRHLDVAMHGDGLVPAVVTAVQVQEPDADVHAASGRAWSTSTVAVIVDSSAGPTTPHWKRMRFFAAERRYG